MEVRNRIFLYCYMAKKGPVPGSPLLEEIIESDIFVSTTIAAVALLTGVQVVFIQNDLVTDLLSTFSLLVSEEARR
ncbi:hypothetical protein N7488_000323 [Penicillium malachiteum]|nr:hypothetical protein N7488_000323 [Penicillium malachiteum]